MPKLEQLIDATMLKIESADSALDARRWADVLERLVSAKNKNKPSEVLTERDA